ncbi:MAG: glycosyltransferase family 39 protein [Aggregatilineales bacterium]
MWGLLAAYGLLACLYSVVTPIFEASDEQWHYPMVKYLADHSLALPVQNPAAPGEWRQEGGQPPLYYMIGAILTSWIDTSDLESVRQINPHADIGIIVPDGNVNMMVHDPARESFPWHGAVLAVHLVRLLSALLGGITVAMTYLLALELFPALPGLALGAAALTAFNPMFLFISGSVNNDNLSNALASALLVLLARLVKRKEAPPVRELILIGVVAGAGMLAKFNIGFLLPLVALALALIAWRKRDVRPLLIGGLVTGGLTVLISGWWYVRNWQLYGDPTGLNVFLQMVGVRPIPADLRELWSERHTFLMSYWGFFGGVNVPLPDFFYTVFNAIGAVSGVGLGVWLVRAVCRGHLWRSLQQVRGPEAKAIRLTEPPPEGGDRSGWLPPSGGSDGSRRVLTPGVGLALARLFTAIWIITLFISLLRWTSVTWASQGRLMFAAISPISVWMAVGLWQIEKIITAFLRRIRIWPLLTFWFGTATAISLFIIWYIYTGQAVFHNDYVGDYHFRMCEPGNSQPGFDLYTWDWNLQPVSVGGYFSLNDLAFVIHKGYQLNRDWSAFIHLVNNQGLIVAQRDVYPANGLLATSQYKDVISPVVVSQIDAIFSWFNDFAVPIPDYTSAPQQLKAYLGFYDLKTGQRMTVCSVDMSTVSLPADPPIPPNSVGSDQILLGTVQLLPRPSALNVPNPMSANFADEAELVGYDVSSLVMHPGQKVTLTLYWRANHKLTTDYHVFVHILDPQTTTIFGQDDAMPAAWTRPTTTWQPGEIIKDEHTFIIHPDAQFGTWQIEVGLYQLDSAGHITRLRVFTPDGGDANDQVYLSRVLIKPNYSYF